MSVAELEPERDRPPLGIVVILRETVSIMIANVGRIMLFCLLPLILVTVLKFLSATGNYAPQSEDMSGFEILALIADDTANVIIFGMMVAFFYNVRLGNRTSFAGCVSAAFRVFIPLTICNLAATLATLVGLIAFIVPGLYLMALWSMLVPSIMIEDADFQGFQRSAALTKNYRWILVLLAAAFLVFDVAAEFGIDYLIAHLLTTVDPTDKATYILADALKTCCLLTTGSALYSLIYLRLRNIKEGTGWLANVFS